MYIRRRHDLTKPLFLLPVSLSLFSILSSLMVHLNFPSLSRPLFTFPFSVLSVSLSLVLTLLYTWRTIALEVCGHGLSASVSCGNPIRYPRRCSCDDTTDYKRRYGRYVQIISIVGLKSIRSRDFVFFLFRFFFFSFVWFFQFPFFFKILPKTLTLVFETRRDWKQLKSIIKVRWKYSSR